eukprot:6172151-Pleurochrysis_carterae.AAC.1
MLLWHIPHDPIGCIRSAAMCNVVPVATIVETVFNMWLRAISGCRTLMYGWTMPYKWGHPVATEHCPSDKWDYMSHSQNDGNSANHKAI